MNWREFPFLLLCLSYITGIAIASLSPALFSTPTILISLLILAFGLSAWTGLQRLAYQFRFGFAIWIWIAFFLLGWWRFEVQVLGAQKQAQLLDATVSAPRICRIQVEEIKPKEKGMQVYGRMLGVLDTVSETFQVVPGRILVYVERGERPLPRGGSILWMYTTLHRIPDNPNPDVFNFAEFLRRQGIFHQGYVRAGAWGIVEQRQRGLRTLLFASRNYCLDMLRQLLPESVYFAIGAALVIGNRDTLDTEVRDVFSKTGAMHILAVSGLHVGMIAWCLSWVLGRISRTQGMLPLAIQGIGVWGYVFLCGAGASVVRAGVMFTWMLFGKTIGRPSTIWNAWSGSAFILLLYEPQWLFDIGFQLSYLAVGGIVLLEPGIYQWVAVKNRILDYFWKLTSVGLAAQIATGPLSIYYFHQFPLGFLLSGWIAVPLGAVIQGLGLGVILFGKIPWLGNGLGLLLQYSIALMYQTLIWVSKIPGQCVEGIWLHSWELLWWITVLGVIVLWWIFVEKIWVWTFLVLLLAGGALERIYALRAAQRKEVICYGISKAMVLEFWSGREVFVWSNGKEASIINQTAGIRMKYGMSGIHILKPDTAFYEAGSLLQAGALIVFQQTRFFIWDGGAHQEVVPPAEADYWVLYNNPYIPAVGVEQRLPRKGVLVDGSNTKARQRYYTHWFEKKGVPVWSTMDQGAWILNVNLRR